MINIQRLFKLSSRFASTSTSIREVLKSQIGPQREQLKKLKQDHGHKSLGEVTVEQCIGGARDVKCMLWETSLLDAEEGIRFRGFTIPEIQKKLPTYSGKEGDQPTPEGLLWLLLTGDIPTKAQEHALSRDLLSRAHIPVYVENLIRSLPKETHPMTQLSIGLMALQNQSKFSHAYHHHVHKNLYWDSSLEDILDIIAKLPEIAALVYRCKYFDGRIEKDTSLDLAGNFCKMIGYSSPAFQELMRLYMVIHSDHEGGNASAHTTHLVGSTLADPYLSFAAGLNALAGPLHGLANQEVLEWIQGVDAKFKSEGKDINNETITQFAWDTLNSGQVIPGYGHAVLRVTDPRYTCQREYALKYLKNDRLFKICSAMFEVVPDILKKQGKAKNPYPNVDSHSGVLLWHYGFTQYQYYTVLFGISRSIGALSQLFWDRALLLPLERPKSVTSEWIKNHFKN